MDYMSIRSVVRPGSRLPIRSEYEWVMFPCDAEEKYWARRKKELYFAMLKKWGEEVVRDL